MADANSTFKFCNRCQTQKPRSDWNRDKNRKDGLSRVCSECARIASRQWREANRERHRESSRKLQAQYREANQTRPPSEAKRCPRCAQTKIAVLFHRDAKRFDGLAVWCIECTRKGDRERDVVKRRETQRRARILRRDLINARQRAFYALNKELFFASNRKRRAKLKGASGAHTAADIRKLLERQTYRCAYCKCSVRTKRHIDHILPLALGGSNDWTNLQALCPTCNLSKRAKHPIQYANSIGLLF